MREFARLCDIGISVLSRISEATSPKTLRKIDEKSDLNTNWLMTGVGQMLKSLESNVAYLGGVKKAIAEETVAVRYFEVSPTTTFQEFCEGMNNAPDTINIYPEYDEVLDETYCAFNVWGDSMAPQIHSNTRVLCREIPPTRWHNLSECVIVIAYSNKFVIKRLAANHLSCEDYIVLTSDNPDYPKRETVQLADIRAIFRAERIISSKIM